jgi:microcystin-dependent protein
MKHAILALAIGVSASFAGTAPAAAQSEPFIGQIMMTGATFCPRDWADLEGQLLPIAPNTALFSLLGTTYGGDGRTNFGLPDMRGRAALGVGAGPGLRQAQQGAQGGNTPVRTARQRATSATTPTLVVRYCIALQGRYPSRS